MVIRGEWLRGLKSGNRICVTSNLVDVRCESSSLLKRMAQSEHVQRRRREAIRIAHLVSPRVLLQVILAPESFAADDAGVRPDASVNPLVSRQFLVPGEGLPAGLNVALERSLACNDENECYIPARRTVCARDMIYPCNQCLRINSATIYLWRNVSRIEKKKEANWRERFEGRYGRSISSTLGNERFKMSSVHRRTCMINVDILYTRRFQLTSVYPNVSFELAIIAEGDVAILAAKFLRTHLLHLLGCNVLPMHHLHRFLHGTRIESRRKDRRMHPWLDGVYRRVNRGIERGMKIRKAVVEFRHYRVRSWWGSRDIRVRDLHRVSPLASCGQVLRHAWKSMERREIFQRANVVGTVRRIPRNLRVGRPRVEEARSARCILNSALGSILEGRRGAGSYIIGGLASSSISHPRASSSIRWRRVRCTLVRETVVVFLDHRRDCRGRRCRRGHNALVVVLLLAVRHIVERIVDSYNPRSLVLRHVPRSEEDVGLQPRHLQACRWKTTLNIGCSSWDFTMNPRSWMRQSTRQCSGPSKTYWTRESI